MSKHIAFGACIFLGSFVGGWAVGNAKASFSYNGQNWQALTGFQKLLYVRGFSVGYQDAIATKEALAGKSLNDAQRALLMRTELYLSGKGEGHHSISEIINAVTTFYGDHRNVSVCWEAAVAFSVMSVHGSPPSDEDVARARHSSGEGCE
jgi:hypothetical protein